MSRSRQLRLLQRVPFTFKLNRASFLSLAILVGFLVSLVCSSPVEVAARVTSSATTPSSTRLVPPNLPTERPPVPPANHPRSGKVTPRLTLTSPIITVANTTTSSVGLLWYSVDRGQPNIEFTIYKYDYDLGNYVLVATGLTATVGATTPYVVPGLQEGTFYAFVVIASDPAGDTAYSDASGVATRVNSASGLSAQQISGTNQVALTWQSNSSRVAAFYIWRAEGLSSTNFITLSQKAITPSVSFVDRTVKDGMVYTYKINSVGYYGNYSQNTSGPSNAVTTSLAAPSNLLAFPVDNNQVVLYWNDNSQTRTGYEIKRTSPGQTEFFTPTLTVTATNTVISYTDNTVNTGETYTYTIRAIQQPAGLTSDYAPPVSTFVSVTIISDPLLLDPFLLAYNNSNITGTLVLSFTAGTVLTSALGIKLGPNLNVIGKCGATGPAITISGSLLITNGLSIKSGGAGNNIVYGLQFKGFGGSQISLSGPNNELAPVKLRCVKG